MASRRLLIEKHDYRPVFERFIGEYRWGSNDCIHLACALVSETCGHDITAIADAYTSASTLDEAIAKAVADDGSVGACYSRLAKESGHVDIIKPAHMAMREAGDVMWVEGDLVTSVDDEISTQNDTNSCIVYVDNAMNMLIWGFFGLERVGGNFKVVEIWRGRVR